MHTRYCSKVGSNYSCKGSCASCNDQVESHHFGVSQCHQESGNISETHDDFFKASKYNHPEPPVRIREENTTSIDLPPLSWHGYNSIPKILSIINTGRTVLINGQWSHGKPFIKGGPLNGSYIFSQVHFHCPSEHEIDGVRYPLEMHVVHYKTCYLTQERAMHEKDGTIVLVYLFRVVDGSYTIMSHISRLAPCLEKKNSRMEMSKISLDQLVKPFRSNYYVYWGSVSTKTNSYLLQWLVNCNHLCVTREEMDRMLELVISPGSLSTNLVRMKPENNAIFHVGEEDYEVCLTPRSMSVEKICHRESSRMCSTVHEGKSCSSIPPCRSSSKSSCKRGRSSCTSTDNKDTRRPKKCEDVVTSADECSSRAKPSTSQSDVENKQKNQKEPGTVSAEDQTKSKNVEPEEKGEEVKPEEPKEGNQPEGERVRKRKRKIEIKSSLKSSKSTKSAKSKKSSSEENKSSGSLETAEATSDAKKKSSEKITTIFEKKSDKTLSEPQKEEETNVQVNFLLTPNTVQTNLSDTLIVTDSEMGDEGEVVECSKPSDCPSFPNEVFANVATTSGLNLPSDTPKESQKEFCLQMEHLFRSETKEGNFSSYFCQEYHVGIEFDNKIIQEYSGMFQPYKLPLGSYEKLNLIPKYQEPGDLNIRLQDCTVKLESLDQFCIRAKFLLKEWAAQGLLSNFKNAANGYLQDSLKLLLDAETQYTIQELNLNKNYDPEEQEKGIVDANRHKSQTEEMIDEEYRLRRELQDNEYRRNRELRDRSYWLLREMEDERYRNERTLQDQKFRSQAGMVEKRECKIRLLRNPATCEDGSVNSESLCSSEELDEGKTTDDTSKEGSSNTETRVKHSPYKYKKTVYFMYDRIEKDVNTGKKIFVGSFRSKKEVEALKRQKQIIQSEKPRSVTEKIFNNFSNGAKTVSNEELNSEELVGVEGLFTGNEENNSNNVKFSDSENKKLPDANNKDVITLHKFKPRSPKTKSGKKNGKNLKNVIIGKVVNQLKKDSGGFVQLAELIGMEKEKNAKISICELEESENDNSYSSSTGYEEEDLSKKGTPNEESSKEGSWSGGQIRKENRPSGKVLRCSETKDSQAAVIIIPVAVESLSKIELILVEHSADVKKEETVDECIPCLDYYK